MNGADRVERVRHTPGPWRVVFTQSEPVIRAGGDGDTLDGYFIAKVAFWGCDDARFPKQAAIWKANAHLIAASPELLEACKQAAGALELLGADADARVVRAAIAKAEGR